MTLAPGRRVPDDFYDAAYFITGQKSSYKPYGPGDWAREMTEMIVEYLVPTSVLDVGCAYGYVVDQLGQQGIASYGFDVSQYAIDHKVTPRVWVGDAADPAAYRDMDVDLITATELPEHLTPEQAESFLANAASHGKRLLMLAVMGDQALHRDEDDQSHIGIRPREWWLEAAEDRGWQLDVPATAKFNEDERSKRMAWSDRFLVFQK